MINANWLLTAVGEIVSDSLTIRRFCVWRVWMESGQKEIAGYYKLKVYSKRSVKINWQN